MDVFGFSKKHPPYRVTKKGIAKTKHWKVVEGKHGKYDKYFIYYQCVADDSGTVFYDREIQKEYRDVIPKELTHSPIEKIEEYLAMKVD